MKISIIAAVAKNNVIGYKNTLPWGSAVPADMKHFIEITRGKPVIMGFNTYKSIGKPLKNRTNIVLVRDKSEMKDEGYVFVDSKEDALKEVENVGGKEAVIIGGGALYNLFLEETDRIYLTLIDTEFEGDAYFPKLDMLKWKEVERIEHKANDENKYNLKFVIYEKTK